MPRTQNPRCDRSALLKSRLQPAAGHCPLALFCLPDRIAYETPTRLKPVLQRNTNRRPPQPYTQSPVPFAHSYYLW
jgi:hypothetical protein